MCSMSLIFHWRWEHRAGRGELALGEQPHGGCIFRESQELGVKSLASEGGSVYPRALHGTEIWTA